MMTVSYCSAAEKRKLCLNTLPPHTGSGLAETEGMLLILNPVDLLAQFRIFFLICAVYFLHGKKTQSRGGIPSP